MAEEKKKSFKEKHKQFWADFKAFISKGSVLDMAVGVIIGAAFKEIINALVNNILMPIITIAIPGGLDGWVTVLNDSAARATATTVNTITYKNVIYDKDIVNVISWGSLVNAILNFLIIAFVLFLIMKIASYLGKKRKEFNDKMQEEYYVKHPEERPAPVAPNAPALTETDLLIQIRDLLKADKAAPAKKEEK